jgi:ribonucleoside-diphosphate reductase beta chain
VTSIREKDQFLIPFIDAISDPHFHTGTHETDQTLPSRSSCSPA